jgi:hypothetical protein
MRYLVVRPFTSLRSFSHAATTWHSCRHAARWGPRSVALSSLSQSETASHEKAEQPLSSGLYLVGTPIGNLEDITFRALRVLKTVDKILCEDTRVTSKLLNYYGIRTPVESYHQHNERSKEAKVGGRPEPLGGLDCGGSLQAVE